MFKTIIYFLCSNIYNFFLFKKLMSFISCFLSNLFQMRSIVIESRSYQNVKIIANIGSYISFFLKKEKKIWLKTKPTQYIGVLLNFFFPYLWVYFSWNIKKKCVFNIMCVCVCIYIYIYVLVVLSIFIVLDDFVLCPLN